MNRVLKRLVIGIIFALIMGGVVYGISYLLQDKPTCGDGVKNGKEEGIDCGTLACGIECPSVFLPIDISQEKIIRVADGDYDFVAKLYNPNSEYGTGEAVYDLILHDVKGEEVGRIEKRFYILPAQTKYLVESSIRTDNNVVAATVEMKSIQWEKLDLIDRVEFFIQNQKRSVSGYKSELFGIALNDSDFDLDRVDITVVLSDNGGNTVAVNKTHVRTLLAHTQRQFVLEWPYVLDFQKLNTTIEFSTNLFLNSNYIKQYGNPEERFQLYY